MAIWPFRPSRASQDAESLLRAVIEASRRPGLFASGRIPDTLDGRFEAVCLYGSLAMIRLAREPNAAPLAQSFTDRLFRTFDSGLREAGIGDLAVPKRMRGLAGAFYGRLTTYGEAIEAGDVSALAAAIGRNALGSQEHPFAPALARHAIAVLGGHVDSPLATLLHASGWPQPPA